MDEQSRMVVLLASAVETEVGLGTVADAADIMAAKTCLREARPLLQALEETGVLPVPRFPEVSDWILKE